MQLQGVLLQTTGIEQITETFKKTNLIIQTEHDTQYPQEVSIEVHNDNIAKLTECGAKPGDIVSVDCNLRGRKYSKDGQADRWFNTIVMWKIAKVSAGNAPAAQSAQQTAAPVDEDPLPF